MGPWATGGVACGDARPRGQDRPRGLQKDEGTAQTGRMTQSRRPGAPRTRGPPRRPYPTLYRDTRSHPGRIPNCSEVPDPPPPTRQ